MDHPPAYGTENGTSSSLEPPPYETASSSSDRQSIDEDFRTLFLNDCRIYSQRQPDRVLYELKSPLDDKTTPVQELTKFDYGTQIGDETTLKPRYEQLYQFKDVFTTVGAVRIEIRGQAGPDHAYKEVFLVACVGSSTFIVDNHFKTGQGVLDRVKNKDQANWTDMKDEVIATETKPSWDKDGNLKSLPKLQIKTQLEEKELNLLVTCWCAKLRKESEKAVKAPMTWDRFKKAAGVTMLGVLSTNVAGHGTSAL